MSTRIDSYALSDVGLQRDNNEDAYEAIQEAHLYIVADGMGGHASGQVASQLAVKSIREYVTVRAQTPDHSFTFPVPGRYGPPERLLSNAIQWANERLFIESMKERECEGMGTTVVCVMDFQNVMVMGHVGDSRIYRYRHGTFKQITRDHSLLNHYIDQGKITSQDEIDNFENGNVIVRALGLKDYVDPEITVIGKEPDDYYLLCTDGLTDLVDDWIIANVLDGNGDHLDQACNALVRLANEAGGKDNCTVMLLHVVADQVSATSSESDDLEEPLEPTPTSVKAMDDTDISEGGPAVAMDETDSSAVDEDPQLQDEVTPVNIPAMDSEDA
jgi:serine/threonine protein phosphatase PrpC